MPDWRNADDYSYTSGLTLHRWAWEFLRRNPRYLEAWKRFDQVEDHIAHRASGSDVCRSAGADWGLAYPVDPNHDATQADFHFSSAIASGMIFGYMPGADTVTVLEIDLEKPIRPQLQIAEKYLRHDRNLRAARGEIVPVRPKIRPQKHLYPIYIRILDGHLAGFGARAIGDVLFPDHSDPRQLVRDRLKAAKKLSGGAYRDLLLMLDE